MKKRVFYLILAMLFSSAMFAQQRDRAWVVDEHAHPNTMVMTAQVLFEGSLDPSLELGAFCGDECRGIATAVFVQGPNNYFWYLNIQGESNEPLNYYVRRGGEELELVTAYNQPFVIDGVFGSVTNPVLIDFVTVSESYYTLITDESQLVPGRQYLIANGFDGNVKAVGYHDDDKDARAAVVVECVNRKMQQAPAIGGSQVDVPYQFTLGGEQGAWTLFDVANEAYLNTDKKGNLKLGDALGWTIDLIANGRVNIHATVSNKSQHMYYDVEEENFSCAIDEDLYLYMFAKCELISGTMESLPIADPTKMFVVEAGHTLSVDNLSTVNVSNLILEDGAQLINASQNVQATMQKAVTGYDHVETSNGWYTVASPMVASAVEVGSNLVFPNYDLYAFDETNLTNEEWRNYKNNTENGFTAFEAGRGYLYANSNTFTPVFKGTLNHADVAVTLTYTDTRADELKGFNLVGNPFPHNIYKGVGGAINDGRLAAGYYVLTNGGEWEAKTYQDAILPGQGILVQTSEAGPLTISKTVAVATAETSSREGLGHVALRITDGNAEDAAYVFGGLVGNLRKINHLNANSPMLSVVRDNERFAIAGIESGCESVDLRFDNHKAGTFNLTVDPMEWEGHYLHLIDNITGTETDLLHTPSYTFSATGDEHPFRFRLVLSGQADGPSATDQPFAFFNGSEWVVYGPSTGSGTATLQVVDMMGRVLNTQTIDGSAEVSINQPTGVYMLRLVTDDDVKVQKVVVR